MIIRSFSYALKVELTESIARYTPYDYTQLEIATMILGVLVYGIILLTLYFDTLVTIFRRQNDVKTLEFAIMIVLTIIAIINAYVYLESPYKSDIVWRFTFAFFALSSIFFVYRKNISARFIEQILNKRIVLFAILLCLFISSMYIYLKFQNIGSEYNVFCLNMRKTLETSKIVALLKQVESDEYNIVFIDSPDVPFHLFKDYIVARVPIKRYMIAVDDPNIQFYKYRLMSGIHMYRFILLKIKK